MRTSAGAEGAQSNETFGGRGRRLSLYRRHGIRAGVQGGRDGLPITLFGFLPDRHRVGTGFE